MWKSLLFLKAAFLASNNKLLIENHPLSPFRDSEAISRYPSSVTQKSPFWHQRLTLHSTIPLQCLERESYEVSTTEFQEHHDSVAYDDNDDDTLTARSEFGLKRYWDDVYAGRGSFPASEYSWYYDYNQIRPYLNPYLQKLNDAVSKPKKCHIYVPGIGNDPIIIDLVASGCFTQITAHDYSHFAIQRQREILTELPDSKAKNIEVQLAVSNIVQETPGYEMFDIILEKGLLDAIYLSDDSDEQHGRLENAVQNLIASLKPRGILVSVSGVVPHELRQTLFSEDNFLVCLRDGSNDLQAGCFLYQKRTEQ
jgi:SAM-dependent methyltransferase